MGRSYIFTQIEDESTGKTVGVEFGHTHIPITALVRLSTPDLCEIAVSDTAVSLDEVLLFLSKVKEFSKDLESLCEITHL